MRFTIPKLNIAAQNFLRQCGYVEISNPHKNNETSYARSLDPGRFYPRFHIYIEAPVSQSEQKFSLHLDAKKPSYEGSSAHSGEYDGPIVENESARIKKIAEKFPFQNSGKSAIGFKNKKSFWERLFS